MIVFIICCFLVKLSIVCCNVVLFCFDVCYIDLMFMIIVCLQIFIDWFIYIEQQYLVIIDMGLDWVCIVVQVMSLGVLVVCIIVVGGINGKGLIVVFIEVIVCVVGWKVGVYIFLYLLCYNECVCIDGQDVVDEVFVVVFVVVEQVCGQIMLIYFEYGIFVVLYLFVVVGLDLVVLEVGLGGCLDVVNIVDVDVVVIIIVDIDYSDWFGEDCEVIGIEKVGIICGWKLVIFGEIDLLFSVLVCVYVLGVNVICGGSDFFVDVIDVQYWCWCDVGFCIDLLMLVLCGLIQLCNVVLVIVVLCVLDKLLLCVVFVEGIVNVCICGCLQFFDCNGVEVLVDVGYNLQVVCELVVVFKVVLVVGCIVVVFVVLQDKDVVGVVEVLVVQVQIWYLVGLDGVCVQSVEVLQVCLVGMVVVDGNCYVSVIDVLYQVLWDSQFGDCVLVFGFFYMVVQVLQWLEVIV